jgi:hypothetical protein
MTPPKTAYFSNALDIMLDPGVCAPIAAKDVKCVSPITLAAKAHTSGGMTINELHQWLNEECENVGVAPLLLGPPDAAPLPPQMASSKVLPQKWRVCTNYMKLNEVTQVLPMPQGDIHTKQQLFCLVSSIVIICCSFLQCCKHAKTVHHKCSYAKRQNNQQLYC